MRDLGCAKNHQRRGRDERCVQALRQRHAVERDHDQPAADHADDGAEDRLAGEFQRDVRGRALPARDEFHQHQGEEDRKRIVGAGFSLQRRADPRAQPQALRMHQKKHRRRVGGGHHRTDQQRLGPAEVEHIFRDRRRDQRRQQHAGGCQHHRRRQHGADALKPRLQSAVEQDQRQRHRSHQVGGADVVELQLAGAGIAGQHADHQKDQQQGRAEAQRQQARQDAGHHQNRAEQDGYADLIEGSHAPSLKIPNTAIASLSPPQLDANPFLMIAAMCPVLWANFSLRACRLDSVRPPIMGSRGHSNQLCLIRQSLP